MNWHYYVLLIEISSPVIQWKGVSTLCYTGSTEIKHISVSHPVRLSRIKKKTKLAIERKPMCQRCGSLSSIICVWPHYWCPFSGGQLRTNSIIIAKKEERLKWPQKFTFQTVNKSIIQIYSHRCLILNSGLRRNFIHFLL